MRRLTDAGSDRVLLTLTTTLVTHRRQHGTPASTGVCSRVAREPFQAWRHMTASLCNPTDFILLTVTMRDEVRLQRLT